MPALRIPAATYRLQMRSEFPLRQAEQLLPYLNDLGVTDCYVSPLYTARPGSVHGYDVVDHSRLNPELGTDQDLTSFLDALASREMGLLLDVVPNHMCIGGDGNRAWFDVLEHGPSSLFARFFDVDWHPPKQELVGKVLLPVLGEQYGRVLEAGLTLSFDDGRFYVAFQSQRLPLAPRSWVFLLEPALLHLRRELGDEEPRVLELESILRALSHLPLRTETSPGKVRERLHEFKAIRQRLAALHEASAEVRRAVDAGIAAVSGQPGDPLSFEQLERMMADQAYRLAHWRVAAHEINYRRFFDINDLAAIRVEDPGVFAAVHELPLGIAQHPAFTGFRIDHVDGLLDPLGYLEELQRSWRRATGRSPDPSASSYLIVEKILTGPEEMPPEWPVDGTTGYEVGGLLTELLVKDGSGPALRELWARFSGVNKPFREVIYETKKLMLRGALAAELTVLARKLDRISEQHRYTRDFTLNDLQAALAEVISCFPAYRTYIRPTDAIVKERDRSPIEKAIAAAQRRNPLISASIFEFVRSILLLEVPEGLGAPHLAERRDWVLRFQQLTGPVVAKGVEDTAFYRHFPLVALNEVGSDPDAFGITVDAFHRRNAARLERSRHGLAATATHDSKRGEDTRARLCALSEMPGEWGRAVTHWRELNHVHKAEASGSDAPDGADEYLLYQTLVGTWPGATRTPDPGYVERVKAYMRKARFEAKVHTSWINPNKAYDDASDAFVDAVLDPKRSAAFLQDLSAFVAPVARVGYWNSLSQLLLKVALPGVPDFFQGTELWDFSLVDPDNRRLVDYGVRREMLNGLLRDGDGGAPALVSDLMSRPEDGRIKMFCTARALRFRRQRRQVFEQGGYEPLAVTGRLAGHVVAFARAHAGRRVIAVAGRHFLGLGADRPVGAAWQDTTVRLNEPGGRRGLRDAFTGTTLASTTGTALTVAELLAHLPIALLEEIE